MTDLPPTSQELTVLPPAAAATTAMIPAQAYVDERLIAMWLHGRSAGTQRAYKTDLRAFLEHVRLPLSKIKLDDLQSYKDSLAGLATASQARKLSAVKSLLSFAHDTGYLDFNVGTTVKLPAIKQTLAERILTEGAVIHMLALERNPRNKALLRLLYLGGLRISEVCGLRVRDLQPSGDAGQITVYGKGGKTRVVLLKASIWQDLAQMRGSDPDGPVFRSRERRSAGPAIDECRMDPSQVHRIVKLAAARAGLSADVSAHWLRHAHVSHALDRGAPAHLVQATVGHASLSTTSRYAYARPNDSSSRYLPG